MKRTHFISDLRRDMNFLARGFLWWGTRPTSIRPGLITSINAAYTSPELRELLGKTHLKKAQVSGNMIGVMISGSK